MINFDVTEQEKAIIDKIAERAVALGEKHGIDYDLLDAQMDLVATHANGNPLDLEKLLDADDYNFSHDVFGIRGTLDRRTGRLTKDFLPRFSA